MKRRTILFFSGFFIVFFCLLFYIFNTVQDSRKKRLYEVSVIINGIQNKYWDAVKQGMDQASSDFNVDLNFVALSFDNDVDEQEAQIMREIEKGVMALIIAPSTANAELGEAINAASKKVVLVEIESETDDEHVKTSVSAGNELLGAALGGEISRGAFGERVTVLLSGSGSQCEAGRLKGLMSAIDEDKLTLLTVKLSPNGAQAIKSAIEESSAGIVVALDAQMLEFVASVYADGGGVKIYGIDSTTDIVNYIEKGVIECVVAQNAYNMGYLSVKAAVDALNGKKLDKWTAIDFSVVTSENIYTPENQRLLFPFVK